jgi:hypothetical protein
MSQNTQAQINTLDIHRMLTLYYQPQLDLQMLETCTIFTTIRPRLATLYRERSQITLESCLHRADIAKL